MNYAAQGELNDSSRARRRRFFHEGARSHGFTLLEICIVLLILGILLGVIAPGMQSALAEAGLRSDARQLSQMVKAAMLQSAEEHRTYLLNLDATSISLGPIAPAPAHKSEDASAGDDKSLEQDPTSTESWPLDVKNKLLLPDPKGNGDWQPLESAQWVFQPGELCPATAIAFQRGGARLEVTFNALTGNVEEERSIFP